MTTMVAASRHRRPRNASDPRTVISSPRIHPRGETVTRMFHLSSPSTLPLRFRRDECDGDHSAFALTSATCTCAHSKIAHLARLGAYLFELLSDLPVRS